MYDIEFTKFAKRQFDKLPYDVRERILAVLERIRIRPQQFVDKLVGESGYKLRVGDYRIFLDIYTDKLIVLVLKLGHRKNVYKN